MTTKKRVHGIRDVARHAGVSTATVSRALNNPALVSAALRKHVQSTIRRLNYIPDAGARALTARRTGTVGAIIPTVDNAMFAKGIDTLQSALAASGYLLLLATSGYDPDEELKQARNLLERGVDALVVRGGEHLTEVVSLLDYHEIPCVQVGIFDPGARYPTMGIDNTLAGRKAAEYLITLGHEVIGVLSARLRNNDRARSRVTGICRTLEAHGLSVDPGHMSEAEYTIDAARRAAAELLTLRRRPRAVVCTSDVLAYGVLLEAAVVGLRVPEEVSVIGIGDLEWSRHIQPALTSVHIPTEAVWLEAGNYLVETLRGNQPVKHREFELEVIERSTVSPYGRPDRRQLR